MRDPGLQPERTELSWSRTALGIAVVAALVIRAGVIAEDRALLAAGVLVAVLSGAALAAGYWRRRGLAEDPPRASPAPLMLLLSGSIMFASVCAVWAFIQ